MKAKLNGINEIVSVPCPKCKAKRGEGCCNVRQGIRLRIKGWHKEREATVQAKANKEPERELEFNFTQREARDICDAMAELYGTVDWELTLNAQERKKFPKRATRLDVQDKRLRKRLARIDRICAKLDVFS